MRITYTTHSIQAVFLYLILTKKYMGMDLYGLKAKSVHGDYFRNNVWWWRPLWAYVCDVCELSEADMRGGNFNDGHEISERKAKKIAVILAKELESGRTRKYAEQRAKELEQLADEKCEICGGTGKKKYMEVEKGCNGCEGKGKRRPAETWYNLTVQNVKEFADFCRESGGFKIC